MSTVKTFNNNSFKVAAILTADELNEMYAEAKSMSYTRRFVTSAFACGSTNCAAVSKYVNMACEATSVDTCVKAYNKAINVCINVAMIEDSELYNKLINAIDNGEATNGDQIKSEFADLVKRLKGILVEIWGCCIELYPLRKTFGVNVLEMIKDTVLEYQKQLLGNPEPVAQTSSEPAEINPAAANHTVTTDNTVIAGPDPNVPHSNNDIWLVYAVVSSKRNQKAMKRANNLPEGKGGFANSVWAKNPISKALIDDFADRAHNAATIDELIGIYDDTAELFLGLEAGQEFDAITKCIEEAKDAKSFDDLRGIKAKYPNVATIIEDAFDKIVDCISGESDMKRFNSTGHAFVATSISMAKKRIKAAFENAPEPQPSAPTGPAPSNAGATATSAQEQPAAQIITPPVQNQPARAAASDNSYGFNPANFINRNQAPTPQPMQSQQPVQTVTYDPNAGCIPQYETPVQAAAVPVVATDNAKPAVVENRHMPKGYKRGAWNAKSLEGVYFKERMKMLNKHFKLLNGTHPGVGDTFVNTLLSAVTNTKLYNICGKNQIKLPQDGFTFVEIPVQTYANLTSQPVQKYDIAFRTEQTDRNGEPIIVYLNSNNLEIMTIECFIPSAAKRKKEQAAARNNNPNPQMMQAAAH